MYCVSVSYKNADINIRKKLAFLQDIQRQILKEMKESGYISQCVLLCTCNRTEVYFCGTVEAADKAEEILARYADTPKEELSPYMMIFHNDNAISHLFRVACGIESMVIGEDEILGQTKSAYAFASECGTVSHELNMIFQSAIACAKKIKTQTALSKTSVSTATLTANEVAKFGDDINVAVIGATGTIGSTVLKNLISHKNINVFATLRNHNSDLNIIENNPKIHFINYAERYKYFDDADCIVSATSSPHYTVTFHELKKYIHTEKNRLFIDLSVPPDIERSISGISGARLIGIDYFEQLAKENNALKLDSVETAKNIIAEETDTLKKELEFHNFLPHIDAVKKYLSNKPFEELLYKLKSDITSEQFTAVLKVLKSFEEKI